jgi:hypothetical protein
MEGSLTKASTGIQKSLEMNLDDVDGPHDIAAQL